jgi:predicted regulator of Ras-like GTPase activity (Roadblock/LC7/MglB family)
MPAPTSPNAVPTNSLEVLDGLVGEIGATRGCVLATVDGFHVVTSSNMRDDPSHSAMLAAAVGLARQLVTIGGGSVLRQMVVDHDGGLLLVWPIGPDRVLAVMTESSVDQRALRGYVQTHVRLLADRRPKATS